MFTFTLNPIPVYRKQLLFESSLKFINLIRWNLNLALFNFIEILSHLNKVREYFNIFRRVQSCWSWFIEHCGDLFLEGVVIKWLVLTDSIIDAALCVIVALVHQKFSRRWLHWLLFNLVIIFPHYLLASWDLFFLLYTFRWSSFRRAAKWTLSRRTSIIQMLWTSGVGFEKYLDFLLAWCWSCFCKYEVFLFLFLLQHFYKFYLQI